MNDFQPPFVLDMLEVQVRDPYRGERDDDVGVCEGVFVEGLSHAGLHAYDKVRSPEVAGGPVFTSRGASQPYTSIAPL
jgi:hypothetical protein